MAETQRLTTPAVHYQISIPAGTPGFPGGYTQDRFRYPWNTAPRASQDVDGLQALVRVDLGGADLTSTTSFRKRTSEYDLDNDAISRSEEHTSELQSLMRTSYAVFGLKKKTHTISHRSRIIHELTPT